MALTEAHAKRRRRYLGASEVPAVLGVSPYKNAADVYHEKVDDLDQWEGNAATEAGNLLEDALIRWASQKLGVKVRRNQWRVHANKINSATLDADIDAKPEAIECKVSGLLNPAFDGAEWGEDGSDEVPETVLVQAQAQMLCADLERVWVPALLGGGRGLSLFKIDRHPDLVQIVLEQSERFWREHVIPRVPPADLTPSVEVLKRVRREPESSTIIDDTVFAAWLEAKAIAKEAKRAEDEAKARLLEQLGTAEAGECSMGRITFLAQSRKGFDSKRLQAEHPDLAAEYLTTSSYRVLRERVNKADAA
jgi:putative phage-type endonuclease